MSKGNTNKHLHTKPDNQTRPDNMRLQCKACRLMVEVVLAWAGRGGLHVKASCPACGGFVKFLPQTAAVLAEVGAKPPPGREGPSLFDTQDGG